MKQRKSTWNSSRDKTFEHYIGSELSNTELNVRAQKRIKNRPHPNSGLFMRRRLGAALCVALAIPAAYVGAKSLSDSVKAGGPECIGVQTLEVPEGGVSPVDLVERNVGGDADPRNITIEVNMIGRGTMMAANAGSTLPEGVSVKAPITCFQQEA